MGPSFLPGAPPSPSSALSSSPVAELCACDLLAAQCDANCCCDPDCTPEDFSLFTTCSIPVVIGDSQLCIQEAAVYSIDTLMHPPERIFRLVNKINPNIFCIHVTNYKQALSFIPPEIPTLHNFDRLLKEFGGVTFNTESDVASDAQSDVQKPSDSNETARYEYGVPIQTSDAFLRLPAPLVFSQCADSSPAGFLVEQTVKCSRTVNVEDCTAIPALSMLFYTNSSILAVSILLKTILQLTVPIAVQSVTVQSLNGTRVRLNSSVMLQPKLGDSQTCMNVVLCASYLLTYTDAGNITSAAVSFLLGMIQATGSPIQQSFEIHFTQPDMRPVPLSGNPGYRVGLPLRAGSTNEYGQLTILRSTANQDCLVTEGVRTSVLFGYNMISGCNLRIATDVECQVTSQVVLNVLKGQNFPEYVASFGNSQAQNVLDWVPVIHINSSSDQDACQIPVSLELEVKWTKYGSLLNPQARIVNVTATVTTSSLTKSLSGSERTIQVLSSVTFTDVSAPAEPGYKVPPAIDAKLPFDFFFPFV
uniref:Tectonic-1 n=1 Tax=Sphenodon punctatus TaxID=8508 RepID=A0A8D0H0L6_SPHPU